MVYKLNQGKGPPWNSSYNSYNFSDLIHVAHTNTEQPHHLKFLLQFLQFDLLYIELTHSKGSPLKFLLQFLQLIHPARMVLTFYRPWGPLKFLLQFLQFIHPARMVQTFWLRSKFLLQFLQLIHPARMVQTFYRPWGPLKFLLQFLQLFKALPE